MGVELTMLTYAVILAFVQIMIPATLKIQQYGMASGVGNRDEPRPLSGWGARAERASANMLETFALFAALVLVAHAAGVSNPTTVMGAQLYFLARLAYAVVYILGIPWVRTLVWGVAVAGMAMIAYALC
jgi:uncharacterized MAPEG superfamily protein